ncbi:unnamed protein product [Paramecium octaurelia]|uniref:Uncharacterized protein n=1 Tax=Paramecium octaurelia TaxID=43137 RepID=A0A8S1WZQ4_PAROT|nr:unnamed protein product [Paramecium octaurelia]
MSSQNSFEELNSSVNLSLDSGLIQVFQNPNDSELDFNQLESAILSSKQEGLTKLIKGSDQYYYQYFLNILNTSGYRLDSKQLENFEQYKKMNTENFQKIRLRSLFMEYDELMNLQQSEKVKLKEKEILKKINKRLFGISFEELSQNNLDGEQQKLLLQKQQVISGNTQSKVGLSELDNSKLQVEEYIKNAYSEKGILKLKINLLTKLDLIQLSKSTVKVIDIYFNKIDSLIIELNNIPEFYNELMKREDYKNKFDAIHFKKLTLSQMKKIMTLNNRFLENLYFVGYLYFKKYNLGKYDKNDENFQDNKEYFLSTLRKAYLWSKTLPDKFKSLSDQILLELLQLGIEFKHFDFDLLSEYLKNPKDYYSNCTQQQKDHQSKIRREYQSFWHEFHDFNFQRWIQPDKMIEKYLEKYFQLHENYSIFELYLEANYLKMLKAECNLYKGDEVTNLTEFFTNSQIKQMNNNKILNLCDNNKQYFFKGDPVTLYLELKNISNLTIKIFQINMRNFYMAKSEQLTSNICLDGFIPTEEISFTYDYPPIKKVIKEFSFESIQKSERGTFIIEFIGNGLSSKAIIEKGRLCLHETVVSAGYKYETFDENFEKLIDEKIGLWINQTYYKQSNGEIILPFPETETNYNAIIQHGDFYQKTQLNLQPEQFQLHCAFILTEEQIQLGQELTTIIIPKLLLNNQDVGFGFFKEQQILVTCVNDKGVPQTFTFKDLIFQSNVPLEVKIPITQQLRNIDIEVSGRIKRLRFDQDMILKKFHQIKFNHGQSQHIFQKQLLKFDQNDGYSIYLLGKNGEPTSNAQVQIQFEHSEIDDIIQEKLITNQQGQIKLGFLKNITKIFSSVLITNAQVEKREWDIFNPNKFCLENYQETFVVGQKLTLKYPSEYTEQDVLFYKTKSLKSVFLPVKNLIQKVQRDNNSIIVEFEKKGKYILEFLREKVIYQFNVLENNVKHKDNLIYTSTRRISQNLADKNFSLENTKISQQEQHFLVEGDFASSNEVRFLALATTFFPKEISIINKQMGSIFYQNVSDNDLRIELRDNIYLSNLQQSEELRYIIERKNQTKYVGNTLEKPQILLNRLLADQTVTQDEQILKQDHNLTGNERKRCASSRFLRKAVNQFTGNQVCDSFTEFLLFPGKVITQIKKDENHFSFEVPIQYSTILILAYTNESYISRVLPLSNSVIQTKNLCHQSSLSKEKFYSTFRSTKQIAPKIPYQIQDISSTEIFILDNLNVLFRIQKELMKIGNKKLIAEDEKFINQLLKWNQESIQSQHKFYNQHQCDELNLFLYFKDPAYFETYISKYISNKIEKSFIDYFLLKDKNALSKYAQVTLFKQLNALEQALLVIYFQEIIGNKEQAQAIALYMSNNNNSKLIKQDDDKFKTLFDTILGIEKDSQSEKEEIPEKKQQEIIPPYSPPKEKILSKMLPKLEKQSSIMRFDSIDYKQNQDDDSLSVSSIQQSVKIRTSNKEKVNKIPEMKFQNKDYKPQEQALKYDKMRNQLMKTFQNAETTNEYCEKHYRYGINQQDFQKLVQPQEFFVDLVNHSIQKGFLKEDFCPPSFMLCNNNFTEILSVLALMSLPFQTPQFSQTQFGNKGLEINYDSSALIFTREIKEAEVKINSNIIINQTFFDITEENYVDQDGNEYEQDLNEFFIKKVYCCKIVVSNCSAISQTFQLLVEIPNGSIPVFTTFSTKTFTLTCAPYQTQVQKYYFYFPKSGKFTIYPANISNLGKVIQIAKEKTLQVYDQKPKVNLENINEILSTDNNQDILDYIENKNIFNTKLFNPKLLYHKFSDQSFYNQVMEIYRRRKFYDFHSFAYSLLHNNIECLKELFLTEQGQNALKQKFKHFKCSLFEINSIRVLEYYPLIIKRVHKLKQGENNILNVQFRKQYTNYLSYLLEKSQFSTVDKIILIYYLLLQERVNEAVQIYEQISEEEQNEQQLQFDYLSAYLDFYTGYPNFQKAREICQKYLSYPVIHWRNMFYEIINLFIEYDGEEDNQISKLEMTQQQKSNDIMKKEETLACTIEGDSINITFSNLQEVKIEYYKLDIEILFSNNPFLKNVIQDFSIVLPNVCVTQKLGGQEIQKNLFQEKIKIPSEISKENLFVTIKGEQKSVTCKYQPTSLFVRTMVDSGQIRVFNEQGQYLSKVYVKVYSKNKGDSETFHKDGYTDIRGRFDYASLSSSNVKDIAQFSMLIYHEDLGSIIQQVQPPPTLAQYEKEIRLIGNKWRQQETQEMLQQQQIYNQKFTKPCRVEKKNIDEMD